MTAQVLHDHASPSRMIVCPELRSVMCSADQGTVYMLVLEVSLRAASAHGASP